MSTPVSKIQTRVMRYENSQNTQTLSILSCTNPLDNKNMYFQSQGQTPKHTKKKTVQSTEVRTLR